MNKIKIPKKTALVILVTLLLAFTTTITGLVVFSHGSDIGLKVPIKDENIADVERDEEKNKKMDEEKKAKEKQDEKKDDAKDEGTNKTEDKTEEPNEPEPEIITTEDVESEEAIPFETETTGEINLPRDEVRVTKEGVEGIRKIVTRLTYRNGELISSEVISSEVVREPVNQVALLGTADFNLSNSYIQLYPNASVTRNGEKAPAFMILVNGKYYMDFWYDPATWNRFAPAKAVPVDGGSFTYEGETYTYETGPLDNNYALSETFCAEYGLACGRW